MPTRSSSTPPLSCTPGKGTTSDVNGAYPKNDGTVGQIPLNSEGLPEHNHYNTDAVWGAYWNLTPLWAIAYPEYYKRLRKQPAAGLQGCRMVGRTALLPAVMFRAWNQHGEHCLAGA